MIVSSGRNFSNCRSPLYTDLMQITKRSYTTNTQRHIAVFSVFRLWIARNDERDTLFEEICSIFSIAGRPGKISLNPLTTPPACIRRTSNYKHDLQLMSYKPRLHYTLFFGTARLKYPSLRWDLFISMVPVLISPVLQICIGSPVTDEIRGCLHGPA